MAENIRREERITIEEQCEKIQKNEIQKFIETYSFQLEEKCAERVREEERIKYEKIM